MNKDYIECNQIKLAIHDGDLSKNVMNSISNGTYEWQERHLLADIVQAKERVMEIGGGIGYISSALMASGLVEKMISYEANPALIPIIQETWRINGHIAECKNAVLLNSKDVKNIKFYIRSDFWASSLSPDPWGYESVEHVPALDFQDQINEFSPTLIVCDIEGGEIDLFSSVNLSESGVKKVFLEIHPQVSGRHKIKDLFDYFSSHNFHYDAWHSSRCCILFSHIDRS